MGVRRAAIEDLAAVGAIVRKSKRLGDDVGCHREEFDSRAGCKD